MSSNYYQLDGNRLLLTDQWTISNYQELLNIREVLEKHLDKIRDLDFSQLERLDTNGVYLLISIFGQDKFKEYFLNNKNIQSIHATLIETVLESYPEQARQTIKKSNSLGEFFAYLGHRSIEFKNNVIQWISFFGATIHVLFITLFKPHRWRITSTVANIDSTGLKAIPIIMLLNFMVGAVVAFLGATVLQMFGAKVFTVHLVAFSFFREFGVLLTAILIAGRTASSYAAQIGSMKINEEIDAIKTNGLNPFDLLVLPRVWALLISLPLLTFFAVLAGLLGGLTVCVFLLDISPAYFYETITDKVDLKHFLIGMSKAPFFAVIIAVTGCAEGFKVTGSAQSVGERTTSAVVQSIFLVILIDALAAIFFMELGW